MYFSNTLERPDVFLDKGIYFKVSLDPGPVKFNPLWNNQREFRLRLGVLTEAKSVLLLWVWVRHEHDDVLNTCP